MAPFGLTIPYTLLLVAISFVLYKVCQFLWHAIHNLFLSPLSKFPGPKIAALTNWWEIYHVVKCKQPSAAVRVITEHIPGDRFIVIQTLHEKYGDIVRIGPNQLSVASPKLFHHIFVTKCSSFLKSDFYATIQPGIGPQYAGLFNYIDHKRAMAERRDVQPMFSPAKIKTYEEKFDKHLVRLISVMNKRKEIDMFTYL